MTRAHPRIAWSLTPGTGPRTIWVHATGFCKEVWDPVIDELYGLGEEPSALTIDQRNHGSSEKVSGVLDWWDLGRDVLAVQDWLDYAAGLGVGHSSGGTALVMAELLRPGAFLGLVLVEPIIFPERPGDGLERVVGLAEKRRADFESLEDAYRLYRGKLPFSAWDDRALRSYLEGGIERDGGRWVLSCRPADEAEFYRAAARHDAWDLLEKVTVPTVIVAGADTDTYPPGYVEELAGRFGDASARVLRGASHLAPMERPADIAAIVAERLRALAR